jgi:hypothetical protein
MHADSNAAGAGIDIVSGQRTLPPHVELAHAIQGQRMRWDDDALT